MQIGWENSRRREEAEAKEEGRTYGRLIGDLLSCTERAVLQRGKDLAFARLGGRWGP
jgi:hypothetical protein